MATPWDIWEDIAEARGLSRLDGVADWQESSASKGRGRGSYGRRHPMAVALVSHRVRRGLALRVIWRV